MIIVLLALSASVTRDRSGFAPRRSARPIQPLPLPRKPAVVSSAPVVTSATALDSESVMWTRLDDRQLYRLLDESES